MRTMIPLSVIYQLLIPNVNSLQINTCDGFYCDCFSQNKAYKPKMWTKALTGWYNESEVQMQPEIYLTICCIVQSE